MGNSASSPGEEEIPDGKTASDSAMGDGDAPAAGSRASATANGGTTAACDAKMEDEAPATGDSTSAAAEYRREGSDATKGDEEDPAAGSWSSTSAAASGEKKKRMVRLSQEQVNLILTYTPAPLPTLPEMDHLPEHIRASITDAISAAARAMRQLEESCLREREWVRKQMEEKGYAEYEVDDDGAEEESGAEVVLPRRGRRRFRPGVRVAGGTVKRVN